MGSDYWEGYILLPCGEAEVQGDVLPVADGLRFQRLQEGWRRKDMEWLFHWQRYDFAAGTGGDRGDGQVEGSGTAAGEGCVDVERECCQGVCCGAGSDRAGSVAEFDTKGSEREPIDGDGELSLQAAVCQKESSGVNSTD